MSSIVTHSKEETVLWGKSLALTLKPGIVLTLKGDLGAGKTTLVQGILAGLGATPPYPSPTFVLMNQYELPVPTATGIIRVYHADAYRVGQDDFEKLGFIEWCADPVGLVLLEWPERLEDLVPEKKIAIRLESLSETTRKISVEQH